MRLCSVAVAVVSVFLASRSALALPITYNIKLGAGTGTAVGAITTDGAIGTLSLSDITAFSLILNVSGTSTTVASSGGFVQLGGIALTATSSGLFFNFDPANSYVLFFNNASSSGLCLLGSGNTCAGQSGPALGWR